MREGQQEYVLELYGITKSFPGVKALDDVQMRVKKGSVHALIGENGAGKSTLIKVINGIHSADTGRIIFKEKEIHPQNPRQMLDMGIATIHQELSPIKELTIAENIFLGREPRTRFRTVDYRKMYLETQALLDKFGFSYQPQEKVKNLTISDLQLIEMLKAVSREASVVIMDEPTSSITETESETLFRCIEDLKKSGISVIYISHKMDEIFRICDEMTIFRDGKWIHSCRTGEIDRPTVIEYMVGRKMDHVYPKEEVTQGNTLIELKGLQKKGVFYDINFKAKSGEIVGFAGLVGAGRTELFRAVFGRDSIDKGEIMISGQVVKIRSVGDAIQQKMVMTPEDRKNEGLILCRSIKENTSLRTLNNYRKAGLIQKKKELESVEKMLKTFSIKMSSVKAPCASLSGGNQQKVVLSKWLLTEPKILILDEPTRGIDVGAKYEIYKFMCDIARQGVAVIMISSELPELIGMCDRIVVMAKGRITGEVLRENFSQEKILALAMEGESTSENKEI